MTIPTLPSAPLVTDIPADFNTKAFNWVAALDNWTTEANATGVAADADAATATSAAGTATTQAGTATTQAGIATSAASTATTQAGIATTKAGEANASAIAAAASAIAAAASAASINLNSIDINGGTIDGTVIGGAVPAAGSFSNLAVISNGQVSVTDTYNFGTAGAVGGGSALKMYNPDATTGYGIGVSSAGGMDISANQVGMAIRSWAGGTNSAPVLRSVLDANGLSVTGALSASGVISTASSSASTITAILAKHSYDPNFHLSSKTGVGGSGAPGDEMSRFGANYNGSWDSFTQYKRGTGTQNGSQVLWAGNTAVVDITSTGAAVTGALSATGAAYGDLSLDGGTSASQGSLIRFKKGGVAKGYVSHQACLAGGTSDNLGIYSASAVVLAVNGSTTASATLDTSGNLGLGVTPSAWGTGWKAVQVGAYGSLAYKAGAVELSTNAYSDGANWIYGATDTASQYQQVSGTHSWHSAPSGTAGTYINFTQSLAVGLGTTLALEGATSAAGCGIAFPATQVASSNANTLDDYEEGTWTPTQGAGLVVVGGFSSAGTYTKVGRQVTAYGQVTGATSVTAVAGTVMCGGLPFTAALQYQGAGANSSGATGFVVAVADTNVYSVDASSTAVTQCFSVTYTV